MKSLLRTDVGLVRKVNEDSAYIGEGLFILCDGMGGHQAGDVASKLTIDQISGSLQNQEPSVGALLRAIARTNEYVCERSRGDYKLRGMGTTLTALWASQEQMLIAQIGDSRAYLLRGGVLRQCTHDHSMVAELVRMGKLTQDEARSHPHKNLVTRALGTDQKVDADIFEIGRCAGDRWLLCSDGLNDQVTDAEIAMLLANKSLYNAADALISLALERGAPDNITIIIIDDEGGESF